MAAARAAQKIVNVTTWARWSKEDRHDFDTMMELGILDRFWTPDEELKNKRGKGEKANLRKGRRDHNAREIATGRAAAEAAERKRKRDAVWMQRSAPLPRIMANGSCRTAGCLCRDLRSSCSSCGCSCLSTHCPAMSTTSWTRHFCAATAITTTLLRCYRVQAPTSQS